MNSLEHKKDSRLFDYQEFSKDKEALAYIKQLEREYYDKILDKVLSNPRYYLDNLERLSVFYVSFIDYNIKKKKGL